MQRYFRRAKARFSFWIPFSTLVKTGSVVYRRGSPIPPRSGAFIISLNAVLPVWSFRADPALSAIPLSNHIRGPGAESFNFLGQAIERMSFESWEMVTSCGLISWMITVASLSSSYTMIKTEGFLNPQSIAILPVISSLYLNPSMT